MTGATHILAAAAVYSLTSRNKPIALALAFGSHFILDSIPHYELDLMWNIVPAMLAAAFVVIAACRKKDFFILIAAFLGAFPDINRITGFNQTIDQLHSYSHFRRRGQEIPSTFLLAEFILDLLFIKILTLNSSNKS